LLLDDKNNQKQKKKRTINKDLETVLYHLPIAIASSHMQPLTQRHNFLFLYISFSHKDKKIKIIKAFFFLFISGRDMKNGGITGNKEEM
jgi:hypothetical protein